MHRDVSEHYKPVEGKFQGQYESEDSKAKPAVGPNCQKHRDKKEIKSKH